MNDCSPEPANSGVRCPEPKGFSGHGSEIDNLDSSSVDNTLSIRMFSTSIATKQNFVSKPTEINISIISNGMPEEMPILSRKEY